MLYSFVVAVASNGVIGRDNAVPWQIPEDMAFFKRVTMGKPMVMGRRTWDSIGRPLPGRTTIVVTRQRDWPVPDGVLVAHSLKEARVLSTRIGAANAVAETAIIGGAEIFRAALPFTNRIYFTEVHADIEGDVLFPEFDRSEWVEAFREDWKASGANPYDYSFVILERAAPESDASLAE